MDQQDLLDLKQDIDQAKDKVNRLEGRKEHLLQELKEDWDCETIKEAKKLLKELKEDIKTMEAQIEDSIEELQEEYDVE